MSNVPPIPKGLKQSVEEIQADRGSVYGSFEAQCLCVGEIISSLKYCAEYNGKHPSSQQLGAFAYIAIKLARYAVSPQHFDTTLDLTSYCDLIHKMEHPDGN